eukprot:3977062-Pyramimonas_sp.AAC.1
MIAVGADLGPPHNIQMRDNYQAQLAELMPKGRQWTCQWISLGCSEKVIFSVHVSDLREPLNNALIWLTFSIASRT